MSLIPLLDSIYDWQDRIPDHKFDIIKKICFTGGWMIMVIAVILWLIFENSLGYIPHIIIAEGMLVLFVTAMNMDDATYIFSTVMWFIGINILFILLFSGLIDRIPVRIR